MEKVVEYIVKELVENKDAVEVSSSVDNEITIINVKVDSNDLGKVIGKQGKTANAIRTPKIGKTVRTLKLIPFACIAFSLFSTVA